MIERGKWVTLSALSLLVPGLGLGVRDACAAYEADLHLGSLKALELNSAILASTDAVTRAWRQDRARSDDNPGI